MDINKIVDYVKSLQKEDGSFAGDKWGNICFSDTIGLLFYFKGGETCSLLWACIVRL